MTQMTEKKKATDHIDRPNRCRKDGCVDWPCKKQLEERSPLADLMQVYRHMDIGSGEDFAEEMKGVKHYLIDVLNPEEEFNVAVFQKMAKDAMVEIYKRGRGSDCCRWRHRILYPGALYDIDFEKEEKKTLPHRKKLGNVCKGANGAGTQR